MCIRTLGQLTKNLDFEVPLWFIRSFNGCLLSSYYEYEHNKILYLAYKNAGCPVQLEFQINSKQLSSVSMCYAILRHISKSPTYEPSSCELSKMWTCIALTSGVSEIAACLPGSGRCPGGGNGSPLQYSSWRFSWTGEPGRLQTMGSQRDKHKWLTLSLSLHFTGLNFIYTCTFGRSFSIECKIQV